MAPSSASASAAAVAAAVVASAAMAPNNGYNNAYSSGPGAAPSGQRSRPASLGSQHGGGSIGGRSRSPVPRLSLPPTGLLLQQGSPREVLLTPRVSELSPRRHGPSDPRSPLGSGSVRGSPRFGTTSAVVSPAQGLALQGQDQCGVTITVLSPRQTSAPLGSAASVNAILSTGSPVRVGTFRANPLLVGRGASPARAASGERRRGSGPAALGTVANNLLLPADRPPSRSRRTVCGMMMETARPSNDPGVLQWQGRVEREQMALAHRLFQPSPPQASTPNDDGARRTRTSLDAAAEQGGCRQHVRTPSFQEEEIPQLPVQSVPILSRRSLSVGTCGSADQDGSPAACAIPASAVIAPRRLDLEQGSHPGSARPSEARTSDVTRTSDARLSDARTSAEFLRPNGSSESGSGSQDLSVCDQVDALCGQAFSILKSMNESAMEESFGSQCSPSSAMMRLQASLLSASDSLRRASSVRENSPLPNHPSEIAALSPGRLPQPRGSVASTSSCVPTETVAGSHEAQQIEVLREQLHGMQSELKQTRGELKDAKDEIVALVHEACRQQPPEQRRQQSLPLSMLPRAPSIAAPAGAAVASGTIQSARCSANAGSSSWTPPLQAPAVPQAVVATAAATVSAAYAMVSGTTSISRMSSVAGCSSISASPQPTARGSPGHPPGQAALHPSPSGATRWMSPMPRLPLQQMVQQQNATPRQGQLSPMPSCVGFPPQVAIPLPQTVRASASRATMPAAATLPTSRGMYAGQAASIAPAPPFAFKAVAAGTSVGADVGPGVPCIPRAAG
eukprot:TRINITY_DN19283_c0_g1_i1.p1 TRINITY_DN19283_c0_g1~~TRINITY_DN19283_c0_g1_i1.p1  ORF type:complete len:793 (-),score=162.78 TRINITY_DN19283_c0_g1_i1:100-2478(-)